MQRFDHKDCDPPCKDNNARFTTVPLKALPGENVLYV